MNLIIYNPKTLHWYYDLYFLIYIKSFSTETFLGHECENCYNQLHSKKLKRIKVAQMYGCVDDVVCDDLSCGDVVCLAFDGVSGE